MKVALWIKKINTCQMRPYKIKFILQNNAKTDASEYADRVIIF